jgi:3-oxoacyl-[acyl-carrier protein] reductase
MLKAMNRTAIITGASSGIGRAIAERLATDGIRVGLLGRDSDRLADAAQATSATAAERADVTNLHEIEAALDRLREALGGVDIVIANAGGTGRVDTDTDPEMAAAAWHHIIELNLTGTFYTALVLARHLPRPGGRLITLSSIAGAVGGPPGGLAYAAAKAGIDGLTRALCGELGPQGIAVNAIAPGYVADTRFFGEDDQSERRQHFAELIPSGRVGRPDDIASLAAFLCTEQADHIHGQILHVNGGQYLAG